MTQEQKLKLWESRCSNEDLTSDELFQLMQDAIDSKDYIVETYVCASIAAHKNATLKLLGELFEMDNPLVLAAVLANPKTPKFWYKKKENFAGGNSSYTVNLDEIL